MPPPRLVLKPYGGADPMLFAEDDLWGWPITEHEEALALRPGLDKIACQLIGTLVHLGEGRPAHGIAKGKLIDNPYWPRQLARYAGQLSHERYVVFLPLALSRTQDDKGRVNWTAFGASEQGPALPFWKSFFDAPGHELPGSHAEKFISHLLHAAFGEECMSGDELQKSGFRILPQGAKGTTVTWPEGALPSWTKPYRLSEHASLRGVKYLLTFRPFAALPHQVQQAYLAGRLHLLPFPGSLVFWGAQPYLKLRREMPLAVQIPLLHALARHEGPHGIRVPQAGWLHEPRPEKPGPDDHHGPVRNSYRRTHRWARVHRYEDELALGEHEEKLVHVLFSASPEDMGLYGKPMARNVQIWSHDFHLLLDGPHATPAQIREALHAVCEGGLFGYRFQFPAMRVGRHEVYWHRPLVAYRSAETGQPTVLPDAPAGYFTSYPQEHPGSERPVEMWPRFLNRQVHRDALELFQQAQNHRPYLTALNIRKILDTHHLLGDRPLPPSFARQLLTLPKEQTLDEWLHFLPDRASDSKRGRDLVETLRGRLEWPTARSSPRRASGRPSALTFQRTARRSFEVAYWQTIAFLAEGKYLNKNNADCVHDPATHSVLRHHCRDLEALGNYLVDYYIKAIAQAKMAGKAVVGELPFHWQTDFDFPAYGGWLKNQAGQTHERDLIVMIPGRDRRRAVVMADHYDTAYMADHYEKHQGGTGARIAAAGADDNHSATAALMLGAPIFLELSRQRRLGCDVWLIHLTGEEFPADCLGARHLCQHLVEGTLKIRQADGRMIDPPRAGIQGVYVLDMVAHNNDRDRDVFQISPGNSRESMWLAYQAHVANEIWNAMAKVWNRRASRRGLKGGRRSPDGRKIPAMALHPHLHGEIRPPYDPRSTLYNTDGQIFSDAGVPVVLFMENYDINRCGYHDSHDTMENIDLDYGAGVAAIAIEAVARAATERP
jgi:hypothetical protein